MDDLYLRGDELAQRFAALDDFLLRGQSLWRPRPFIHRVLPWESEHPELAAWLRARSLDDAEAFDNHPERLNAPGLFAELAREACALASIGPLPTAALPPAAARLNVDVPGRKWQQIEAFGTHLGFARPVTHWLDWCAGKGHLGRRLLRPDQHLTCLEYDPALVRSGEQLSQHHHLTATHQHQDVLAPDLHLPAHCTPVALHACGDLHVRLLQRASTDGCTQLAIAPCCYNRTADTVYRGLSPQGTASALHLDRDDLGLPASETVTAGARVRRQRDRSMARRLGFDLWQRQARGVDEYLSTPSLPVAWLDTPFEDYCRHLAQLKGLTVQAGVEWAAYETAGQQRLAQVRNLEQVRNLFRRPLELWLALDRALYLHAQGYDVRVGTFCDASLTPRNLMIIAETSPPCG